MFYDDEPMEDGGGAAMPPMADEDEDGEKSGTEGGDEGGNTAM